MTVHQAIAQLTPRTTPLPTEAIACLRENWPIAEPLLLQALDDVLAKPTKKPSALFYYALFLCAEMRSQAAFERYIKICRLTTSLIVFLLTNLKSNALANMLAASCHGRVDELQAVVEDESRDAFARSEALDALCELTFDNQFPYDNLKRYCLELLDFRLEPQPSFIWTAAICLAIELGLTEALPLIEEAYANALINEHALPFKYVVRHLAHSDGSLATHKDNLKSTTEEAMLSYLTQRPASEQTNDEIETERIEQLLKQLEREDYLKALACQAPVGRNDLCPCGSGKKYKKCCINEETVERWEAPEATCYADQLIDCGYACLERDEYYSTFLCWNRAWREIVDTNMIPAAVVDVEDPACELFDCCESFSEWLERFAHLIIDSEGLLPVPCINKAIIDLQESIHRFPVMPEALRVKVEHGLAICLAKTGQPDEAETLFMQSLSRSKTNSAIYMVHGMRKGVDAAKLNLRPDWESALVYAEKALQLADEDLKQHIPFEEHIQHIKRTIALRALRAERAALQA